VTGAAGNIGYEAVKTLDDHDVTPVTHSEDEQLDSEVVDVEHRDAVRDVLAGQDVVVYLAANPHPGAD
jgi:L-arabinose 1-dehydrogenase [NAD(P)+]